MKLSSTGGKELSVVIPAYDEELSLPILVERFIQTFEKNGLRGEIIIVDDGSTDETGKIAHELSGKYTRVKIFHHKRRMGKTAALLTGLRNASGDILVMMDADLQYAPEDLPTLLNLIEQGYDVVNGWRKHRKDSIFKKIPSSLYNFISRISFGLSLHDYNSGFKIMRREVFRDISPRKEQHRFILHLAHYKGYKVGEAQINHFPRKYGKTKYGSSRVLLGFLDMISLKLQLTFTERPMVLFGLSGITLLVLGFILGMQVLIWNLVYGEPFAFHFARLLLSALLTIAGIQSFLFGFIADMIANLRTALKKS